ncbi:hypothetical protein DUI87_27299 [Hirundo rustica rustica]|uniref:Uncharacterized protein n=1 Tax=Hirundo rustica rustica TaxID=333673 RepID=A0A3M0JN12_HIRRU|nr:hypothetical protein DUI87_27299 [Hirundo rustica rustica]
MVAGNCEHTGSNCDLEHWAGNNWDQLEEAYRLWASAPLPKTTTQHALAENYPNGPKISRTWTETQTKISTRTGTKTETDTESETGTDSGAALGRAPRPRLGPELTPELRAAPLQDRDQDRNQYTGTETSATEAPGPGLRPRP